MENFDFYKNKFERELNRRNYLDGAINSPIIGVTAIVTLNSYIVSKSIFKEGDVSSTIILTFLVVSFLLVFIAVIFIFLSINNLFKGFHYQNFGLLKDFREFELELEKYNQEMDSENLQLSFKQQTVEKIIQFSDNHTIINDKRALNLYRSRSFIILSVLLTFLNLSFVTVINFKMAEENKPVVVSPPSNPPAPPRMPTDRIEKGENPTIQTK